MTQDLTMYLLHCLFQVWPVQVGPLNAFNEFLKSEEKNMLLGGIPCGFPRQNSLEPLLPSGGSCPPSASPSSPVSTVGGGSVPSGVVPIVLDLV